MGNGSSKQKEQGLGHPSQFYEGCTAAERGSYTISEIAFQQAMKSHPGHAFWVELMELVTAKTDGAADEPAAAGEDEATKNETGRTRNLSADGLPSVLPTSEELITTVFVDGHAAKEGECDVADSSPVTPPPQSPPPAAARGEATMSLNGSAAELDSRPTLVLPVDHRLVDVQDYVRMLTDIGRIYRRKSVNAKGDSREMSCRLNMLYSAYTAVRLEAMLTVFRGHFAAHNTDGDPHAEDKFQIYAQRTVNAQWGTAAFRAEINTTKSVAGQSEATVSSPQPSSRWTAGERCHDEELCLFWQSIEYFRNVNVLCYATSALQILRVSDYAVSPATQKAMLEMTLRCLEVVEQDLVHTAEMNSHLFFAVLMKRFVSKLLEYKDECRAQLALGGSSMQRWGGKQTQRTVKGLEPKYLRLGTPNFAERQLRFLRTAMHFPLMTLPLLDMTKVVPVELQLQYNGNRHRSVKLMTPLDRSYAWYIAFPVDNQYEREARKPGQNEFLLQKCGAPPHATLKDPIYFTCVGLQDFGPSIFPLSMMTARILYSLDKAAQAEEVAKITIQASVDVYGGESALSKALKKMFENLKAEAAA